MHRGTYPTDAGMHALWDVSAFSKVTDYETWERELLDDKDIARHIQAGHFVPLNIGSDGAMEVEVRVGTAQAPAALDERATRYLIVASEAYRLRSSGQIGVSGIEHVQSSPEGFAGSFTLPKGEYAVTVHLMAWDEEPGMQTDDGPAAGALPDYLVLINPADANASFRTDLRTFPSPNDN